MLLYPRHTFGPLIVRTWSRSVAFSVENSTLIPFLSYFLNEGSCSSGSWVSLAALTNFDLSFKRLSISRSCSLFTLSDSPQPFWFGPGQVTHTFLISHILICRTVMAGQVALWAWHVRVMHPASKILAGSSTYRAGGVGQIRAFLCKGGAGCQKVPTRCVLLFVSW